MVNYQDANLTRTFSALSDPTRRGMITRLAGGTMSVAELAEPFDMSKSAITKHLKVLEDAGFLTRSIEGRVHRCRLNPDPLVAVSEWVKFYESFWHEKFDALDAFLSDEDSNAS